MMYYMNQPPQDVKIQVNIRLPWEYHEQLKEKARAKKQSFNSLVVESLEQSFPPETPTAAALRAANETKEAGATR